MNFSCRYFLLALVCVVFSGFGQTAAPPPQSPDQTGAVQSAVAKLDMPSDPAALLALAAKKNGLQNAGIGPWHIKATYQLLDDAGAVKETGTFEEFRVSEKVYKLSYASPSFNQTDYSNDKGSFRTGSPDWPDGAASSVHRALFPKLPSSDHLKGLRLSIADKTAVAVELKCVSVEGNFSNGPSYKNIYCLDKTRPSLRIITGTGDGYQTVFNDIFEFAGTYTARDFTITRMDKQFVRVHIDLLEQLSQLDQSIIAAPPDAKAVLHSSLASAVFKPGKTVFQVDPQYPPEAKKAGVRGTVLIQTIVGKDGKIMDLRAVSGPSMLIQAAVDCVRQWSFTPFLADGVPFEPQIEVSVVFR
jgi:TonB family protein